jgi:protein-tyrosine phosphatase
VIDMHLHILPAVDDGAQSIAESAAMMATLSKIGFDRLIATPHLMEPLTDSYHQEVIEAMKAIAPAAVEANIGLGLGYEHLLSPTLVKRLIEGEPSTLAGSHAVLVELPFMHWPADTAHNLFTLREAGYRPVLAHPERYVDAMQTPQLVLDAIEHGAIPQLTTGSFIGLYGRDAQRLVRLLALSCLEQDRPFLLSSDGHSNGRRLTSVADGLAWISQNMMQGDAVVEWATTTVPLALVADVPVLDFRAWLSEAHADLDVPAPGEFLDSTDDDPTERPRRGLARLFRGGAS